MFAMNPGMINGTFSSNWTAAPDLETLVAQASATSSIASATATTTPTMGTASSDYGPNNTGSVAAAAASQASNGESRRPDALVL